MPQWRGLPGAWAGAGGPGDAGRGEGGAAESGWGDGFEARVKSAENPTREGTSDQDGGRLSRQATTFSPCADLPRIPESDCCPPPMPFCLAPFSSMSAVLIHGNVLFCFL